MYDDFGAITKINEVRIYRYAAIGYAACRT